MQHKVCITCIKGICFFQNTGCNFFWFIFSDNVDLIFEKIIQPFYSIIIFSACATPYLI